eukprot:COSAG04_NODE_11988_length_677_cov_0.972318_1_plen_133_part_10
MQQDDGDVKTVVDINNATKQSLYESLQATEKAGEADEGLPFTSKQLEEVINHLVEMMAQSHIRCLPDHELHKLAPGFDRKSPELIQADFDPMDGWSVETMSNDLGWSAEKMKNAWSAEKMNAIWSIYYDVFHS